ncbi:MAG: tRNA pseudouridine(38-40) synthase TruA [Pseudomonadota bacterium]
MKVALGIEYHGLRFHGWQQQLNLRTVEEELTRAVARVANHPVELFCAGRTDKGVHALGQVVHFETEADRQDHNWLLGINAFLPADIAVKWATTVLPSFHARFAATARSYCYIIYNHQSRPACMARQFTWIKYPLSAESMAQAGQYLIGEHDFSAFRASACQAKSPIRTIHHLSVHRQGDLIVLKVTANAFLHHMVRNIAGVLIAIGANEAEPKWALQVLNSRRRDLGGVTARPDGLYLTKVTYPDDYQLPAVPVLF